MCNLEWISLFRRIFPSKRAQQTHTNKEYAKYSILIIFCECKNAMHQYYTYCSISNIWYNCWTCEIKIKDLKLEAMLWVLQYVWGSEWMNEVWIVNRTNSHTHTNTLWHCAKVVWVQFIFAPKTTQQKKKNDVLISYNWLWRPFHFRFHKLRAHKCLENCKI